MFAAVSLQLPVCEEDEDGEHDEESDIESVSPSQTDSRSKAVKRPRATASTSKVDDALLSFMQRPRASDLLVKKVMK